MVTTTVMGPYHHVGVGIAPTIGSGSGSGSGSGRDRPTIIIVTTSQQRADDGASRSEKQQTTRTRRRRRSYSHPLETRTSLVLALASQASSLSQRVISELATETAKYVFPPKSQPRNLEEALMSVPDLETVNFEVLKQTQRYDIRQVQAYFIAETKMPGNTGFGFDGSSQAFNVLAAYLFGKNTKSEAMEMTTPVYTRKVETKGEKMEMTTPVITRQSSDNWQMSFVLPSKYGANLPSPKDTSVRIREVPSKIVAVTAFSGFVTDEEVSLRESWLRDALRNDTEFQVKPNALVEVAQFNPPFTLPFTRRNEISLDVERRKK